MERRVICIQHSPAFTSSFVGKTALQRDSNVLSALCASTCSSLKEIHASSTIPMARKSQFSSLSTSKRPSRRKVLQQVSLIAAASILSDNATPATADAEFSIYKGPISLGYSFSYPSSWKVKKKPIRTHLSEIIVTDSFDSSSSAGLVVDAVKIESIDKFGTPNAVGEKVVALETKKESVKEAYLSSTEAVTKDGLTYYIIDYTVDSTRGNKRFVAKVTITGGQLYVLTTQAGVENFSAETEKTFTQMLDSFNVVKQYL